VEGAAACLLGRRCFAAEAVTRRTALRLLTSDRSSHGEHGAPGERWVVAKGIVSSGTL
jgi:hypothetical protein